MKKQLRRTEEDAGRELEHLINQACAIINNIKRRAKGGFGVTDGSFPMDFTGFVNVVNRWLNDTEFALGGDLRILVGCQRV